MKNLTLFYIPKKKVVGKQVLHLILFFYPIFLIFKFPPKYFPQKRKITQIYTRIFFSNFFVFFEHGKRIWLVLIRWWLWGCHPREGSNERIAKLEVLKVGRYFSRFSVSMTRIADLGRSFCITIW
jgi:hypothetical protein